LSALRAAGAFPDPPIDGGEQVAVLLPRRLALVRRFLERVSLEDGVARWRWIELADERRETCGHPALPVDQRSIAIERQRVEILEPFELHEPVPSEPA
jgi:hypothetical protein